MTRSFIIDYTITGDTDLASIADDIYTDLVQAGHNVQSVKPFAPKGKGLKPAAPAFNPTIQPL